VAEFVSKYAGRQSPKIPGAPICDSNKIGTLPPQASAAATSSTAATGTTGASSSGG
jgi:hypothetical protein